MMKFTFAMAEGTYHHYLEAAECLMRYGGMSWSDAERAINDYFTRFRTSLPDDPEMDLHDSSYDISMFILHRDRAIAEGYKWWKDPKWKELPSELSTRWFEKPQVDTSSSMAPALDKDSLVFSFSVEGLGQEYFLQIVEFMVRYGEKSIPEAFAMLNEYVLRRKKLGEEPSWIRETPYFWAMGILHEKRMVAEGYDWTKDPKFFPPPPAQ